MTNSVSTRGVVGAAATLLVTAFVLPFEAAVHAAPEPGEASSALAAGDEAVGRAIPYAGPSGFPENHVWYVGAEGHLHQHAFGEFGWNTTDHGDANGEAVIGQPAALTDWDGHARRYQVWMTSAGGHLYAHSLEGADWRTTDHGGAANHDTAVRGVTFVSAPAVNTYWDGRFNQIHVWVLGSDGHLYVRYLNQGGWHTDDHLGAPGGVKFVGNPAAITHRDGTFNRVEVWMRGSDGHLYTHSLVRGMWRTEDQGDAAPGITFAGDPAAISYSDARGSQVQVWARGSDDHLYVRITDNAGSRTDHHGIAPTGAPFAGTPTVLAYWDGAFNQLQVWMRGSDGHLYLRSLGPNGWRTADHGLAAPGIAWRGDIAATTYWDGTFNQVQVFAEGTDGHLYERSLREKGWQTEDHCD
jgi:hypothetical protein